jgi:hypothetical protein
MENEKRICQSCGKTLRSIGPDRANGKEGKTDWNKRKYHSKCYKKLGETDSIEYWKRLIKQYAVEE